MLRNFTIQENMAMKEARRHLQASNWNYAHAMQRLRKVCRYRRVRMC